MRMQIVCLGLACAALLAGAAAPAASAESAPKVQLMRVPDGGLQPHAVVDSSGRVHLVYYKGDARAGDLFYCRSDDDGRSFGAPIRVNSQHGSAVAMGTIRGAHLSVGKGGRVHIAWNGSHEAHPRNGNEGGHGDSPMLYSRLDDSGRRFEPQRNLMTRTIMLDGGGSIAADDAGNVYVTWHGLERGTEAAEANRRVWVARSDDQGATFAAEVTVNAERTGACGCCGLRAFVDRDGRLSVLYRTAADLVNRDIALLLIDSINQPAPSLMLDRWKSPKCPMSSASIISVDGRLAAAWETRDQVFWSTIDPGIDPGSAKAGRAVAPPNDIGPVGPLGRSGPRKHPVLAANDAGLVILAWTEGTGWNRGGSVAWQVFDASQRPIADPGGSGRMPGVPVWSLVTAFARSDGSFVVMY